MNDMKVERIRDGAYYFEDFDCETKAVEAYNRKSKDLFGGFVYQNIIQ